MSTRYEDTEDMDDIEGMDDEDADDCDIDHGDADDEDADDEEFAELSEDAWATCCKTRSSYMPKSMAYLLLPGRWVSHHEQGHRRPHGRRPVRAHDRTASLTRLRSIAQLAHGGIIAQSGLISLGT